MIHQSETLIVGTGIAGLVFALDMAEMGSVLLLTKAERALTNTGKAQGGIAAAWAADDAWKDHVEDTLTAGAGLCRRAVVEHVASRAREAVEGLIGQGCGFDRSDDGYDLHHEGGHSARRILHSKDSTGKEIMRALLAAADAHPNIEIREHQMVVDLITEGSLARRTGHLSPTPDKVLGLYALNTRTEVVEAYCAKVVALCTGGAGKVYLYTSNPDIASGDGVAIAWRAGARIANMEFVQFHPTCLFHPEARNFLISEALRGEGGILRNGRGEAFMARYDERRELAPRDIVARAIDAEIKRSGDDCAWLDMRHMDRAAIEHHFPTIDARCRSLGIDMAQAPIPVVPAAHYFCGGVMVDLNGETDIENLFAIGEVSCTGLHGANRLASNSLLEAAVFAKAAAKEAGSRLASIALPIEVPSWDSTTASEPDEQVVINQIWDEVRRFMWNYVGIVRTNRRLLRARKRIDLVQEEIQAYYWDFKLTGDLVELRNLATVAELVVECALRRRESRGLHFNTDYPEADDHTTLETVLQRRW
jgi:L-aspartate oxidase